MITLAVNVIFSPVLSRTITAYRSFSVTEAVTVGTTRLYPKLLAVTTDLTTSMNRLLQLNRTLSVTETIEPILSRALTLYRSFVSFVTVDTILGNIFKRYYKIINFVSTITLYITGNSPVTLKVDGESDVTTEIAEGSNMHEIVERKIE